MTGNGTSKGFFRLQISQDAASACSHPLSDREPCATAALGLVERGQTTADTLAWPWSFIAFNLRMMMSRVVFDLEPLTAVWSSRVLFWSRFMRVIWETPPPF